MKTIFLSGSRKLGRLNDQIHSYIESIVRNEPRIVVGDANGVDKALQRFLADLRYSNVVIFHVGAECRNNIGNWRTVSVPVNQKKKDREFYMSKDRAMVENADWAFVIWDGKSIGSLANVLRMVLERKLVIVYLSTVREFFGLKEIGDVEDMILQNSEAGREEVHKIVAEISDQEQKFSRPAQGAFSF